MTTDEIHKRSAANEALMDYRQADEEGIIVLASRQAIHEVDGEIATLARRVLELEEALKEARLQSLADGGLAQEAWEAQKKAEARVQELEAVLGGAKEVLLDVQALIDDSDGVAGFHLNGDVALWEKLGQPEAVLSTLARIADVKE